ncbi:MULTISPECIES: alkene reductase [Cyanophyceae]|uniref:alkene reductase n=1 Tax=Cyanophyceae TaxID=3028117 RepID=UPI0016846A67|nr:MULTISPECIES: alkene reductase [Cyanophyceae]MBD1914622.1 alkene reductase [Phormidium sp. FACHB-77]MBD2030999.1 alkene reductase [Phormidium sp. FACHB-322]MBD2052606.1 alkene reductase [Leptolyngbya sp. FACHB-60]
MSTEKNLFTPIKLGAYELPNRIVMAPLTRNRAGEGNVPQALNVTYYEQRASAALIITEASQVSPQGQGYPATPGIHSAEQIAGWQKVIQAVHAKGGRIFLQLWHVGRISHPSLQPDGATPVAPSAIKPKGDAMTYEGMQPFVTPRALELDEIPGIVEQYRQAAKHALKAGFDGVEVHGANGYLLDQFLRDGSNHRTDAYGGPVENRARLLLEVTEAVVEVFGSERVGVRLSPSATFNDMTDSDPRATFGYAIQALNQFNLAYLHLLEPSEADLRYGGIPIPTKEFRPLYDGLLMVNWDYDQAAGNAAIASGDADLVSYGKLFIANPDLPDRFAKNAPLNEPNPGTFYGGGEEGYIDYPTLAEAA